MADRVAVMYAGKIVEYGTVDEIFYNPKHPYTWGLLNSMPTMDTSGTELPSIPGTPPDLLDPPKGDAFAPRNQYALKIDTEKEPPFSRCLTPIMLQPGCWIRGHQKSLRLHQLSNVKSITPNLFIKKLIRARAHTLKNRRSNCD